jgi:hypothetical protein
MKIRHVAALALAIWYLLTPPDVSHRAWMTPPPDNYQATISPTAPHSLGTVGRCRSLACAQAEVEAEHLELWKAQHKAEVAIAWNPWVFLVPHVKGMMPTFILDKNALAGPKGIGKTGIRVWVDSAENVPKVERWVPSQLGGVPVVVEANPTLAWP